MPLIYNTIVFAQDILSKPEVRFFLTIFVLALLVFAPDLAEAVATKE